MNVQMIQGFLLSVSPDTKYPAFSSESLVKAVEVAVLGMSMVFLVLAILWGVLAIFKVLFSEKKKDEKTEKVESTPAPVAEPEPVAVETQDDGELIAVITAAIEAYRSAEANGDENYVKGFRVVSFKRVGAGRPWNSK